MPQDIFGLSGKYYGSQRPLHDPEDHIMPEDLCDSVSTSADNLSQNPPNDQLFYPYPNRNSFSLGEWYWNQGVQKSKQAFLQLIKIIGDPGFTPSDIHLTNWDKIDTVLANNAGDDDPTNHWLGEDKGWNCTAISILVPLMMLNSETLTKPKQKGFRRCNTSQRKGARWYQISPQSTKVRYDVQSIAKMCKVLQRTAKSCKELQRTVKNCKELQRTAKMCKENMK